MFIAEYFNRTFLQVTYVIVSLEARDFVLTPIRILENCDLDALSEHHHLLKDSIPEDQVPPR